MGVAVRMTRSFKGFLIDQHDEQLPHLGMADLMPLPSSSAKVRRLLQVHRKGDSEPPRGRGSTKVQGRRRIASRSVTLFLPAPGLLMRESDGLPSERRDSSSFNPSWIARRETPVAAAAAVMPPCPKTLAPAAQARRRIRSSSAHSRSLYLSATWEVYIIRLVAHYL